jgi:hypothetical protein
MPDAARKALSFAENRSRTDLGHDRMLLHSIVRNIEILGEAAAKVSPECRDSAPNIPWARLVGETQGDEKLSGSRLFRYRSGHRWGYDRAGPASAD